MLLKRITKTLSSNIPLILAGLLSLPTMASAVEGSASVKSISYASSTLMDDATKHTLLEQTDSTLIAATPKEGFRTESAAIEKTSITTLNKHSGNFSIYDVSSNLISDIDYDSFYHHFSITIDADTLYNSADVYAKIYLSYEGGPWNYMASSDTYHIDSDSAQDAFTIETELGDGFYAGYYDVRIELYDANFNEWLLSYGPYENSALSTLPLEDSYNDNFYDHYTNEVTSKVTTEVYVSGHGSMSTWWILALSLMIVVRKLSSKPKG